jgi:hypothetical protein
MTVLSNLTNYLNFAVPGKKNSNKEMKAVYFDITMGGDIQEIHN